jgi:hypothetical protein
VANGRILAAGIPHATLHVYHGGHVELATRPSLLTPLITSFLAAPPHDARRGEQVQTGRHPEDQGPRQAADGTAAAQAAQATAEADALAEALQAARAAQQAAETAAGQAAAREQAAAAREQAAATEGASALRALRARVPAAPDPPFGAVTVSRPVRPFQVAKRGGPPRVCLCDGASPSELRLTVRTASPGSQSGVLRDRAGCVLRSHAGTLS